MVTKDVIEIMDELIVYLCMCVFYYIVYRLYIFSTYFSLVK